MAQPAAIVKTQLFISRSPKDMALTDAVAACGTAFHQALALLYAPHKCFLALVNDNGRFEDSTGEIDASVVFEARIFNAAAELRWLNKENGEGAAVVLCEDSAQRFFNAEPKPDDEIYAKLETPQTYLLWGQSVEESKNGWTKFAEARIRPFFVPLDVITAKPQRAQFTVVEYLGEHEDGNVAVTEERLTGIVAVETEQEANNG